MCIRLLSIEVNDWARSIRVTSCYAIRSRGKKFRIK